MNEPPETPRWSIPEVILLVFVPIVVVGPDALQRVLGRLPELLQLLIPFSVAAFVALSAGRLAVGAVRAGAKAQAALSAVCASPASWPVRS